MKVDHAENAHNYSIRNAFAAAVESLLVSNAKPEQVRMLVKTKHETLWSSRVQTGPWMYGFYLDVSGLDRKAEKAIVADVEKFFPALRVKASRKTVSVPRSLKFSF